MTQQQLTTTTNFSITYDDSINEAKDRADAIAATCEADLAVLTGWFGITGAFGPDDRIGVLLGRPLNGGGSNGGYQSGGSSSMDLDAVGSLTSSVDAAHDIVRTLFVAELAEILMSWNRQHANTQWNPGDSSGEGLSQLCASTLYPAGYSGYNPGGWVNTWLASDRPNWVSVPPEATDQNPLSFASALLFLFYLRDEFGVSIQNIISQGASATTLADIYRSITGTSDDPWPAFIRIVNRYLPGTSIIGSGDLSNPFPLHDPILTALSIVWHNSDTGQLQIWNLDGAHGLGSVSRTATIVGPDGSAAAVGPPFVIVGVNDYDGNGTGDILWHHEGTGEVQLWFLNGSQLTQRASVVGEDGQVAHVGPPFSIVGTNGAVREGSGDIVWHNSQTGEIQHWYLNANRVAARATVIYGNGQPALIGPPWSIVGTGIFDDDATPGILWYNSATGEIQLWFMNGPQGTRSLRRTANVVDENGQEARIGPPWSIVATLDIDRNDRSDILWHNSATGEIQIWLMNGERRVGCLTVRDEHGAPALIGPPWSIVGATPFATELPWGRAQTPAG